MTNNSQDIVWSHLRTSLQSSCLQVNDNHLSRHHVALFATFAVACTQLTQKMDASPMPGLNEALPHISEVLTRSLAILPCRSRVCQMHAIQRVDHRRPYRGPLRRAESGHDTAERRTAAQERL